MSKEKRILVVDDDPELLRMIEIVLQRAGFQVFLADDGTTGLKMVEAVTPDLIISDVMMANMDGLEMCRRLRTQPATRHIPVIMLSALGDMENMLKGFNVGADDYVAKPVNTKELVARVMAVLNRIAMTRTTLAHTFSFMGAKGGVGVSTVAMNVASRLAQMEYSVILAELRPYNGSLRQMLRFKKDAPRVDLGPLLAIEPSRIKRPEVERCLLPHASGMQVLLAPMKYERPLTVDHVEAIFDVLSVNAQYVVFDMPPFLDEGIVRALQFSDEILLVTEPEELSVMAAANQVKQYKHWGVFDRVNMVVVERTPFSTSLNQVEVENKTGLGVLEHLKNSRWDPRAVDMNPENKQGVISVIPPAAEAFQETVQHRVPLVMIDPNAKPAHALLDVADWLLDRHPVTPGGGTGPLTNPPEERIKPNVDLGSVSVSAP